MGGQAGCGNVEITSGIYVCFLVDLMFLCFFVLCVFAEISLGSLRTGRGRKLGGNLGGT